MTDKQNYETEERAVIRHLREKGYEVGNSHGIKLGRDETPSHISILDINKTKTHLRGTIKKPLYLADLVLHDQLYQGWHLEVFGEDNIPQARELANELSETYDKKVDIKLETEKSKYSPPISMHSLLNFCYEFLEWDCL